MQNRIKDVLAHKGHHVHSIPAGITVGEAARRMADLEIGSFLVESDGHPVGILTERDLARRVCCSGDVDPTVTPVEQVMTSPLAYIEPEMTVGEAMKVMSETHCRHLPVFDKGELVGLVSLGDLIRWITADLEENVRYLESYILRG